MQSQKWSYILVDLVIALLVIALLDLVIALEPFCAVALLKYKLRAEDLAEKYANLYKCNTLVNLHSEEDSCYSALSAVIIERLA